MYTKLHVLRAGLVSAAMAVAIATNPSSLFAQTTHTLTLKTTVVQPTPTCTAVVNSPATFADLDAGATVANQQFVEPFSIDFTCTGTANATAEFDGGQNANPVVRHLAHSSGALVGYTLAENNSQIIPLDGQLNISLAAGNTSVPLKATIGVQTVPGTLGTYTDQVTVTITF